MYSLSLTNGRRITSADLQESLANLDCGPTTHVARTGLWLAIGKLETSGARYSNQDFDVLSHALNFIDAVNPEHSLRG